MRTSVVCWDWNGTLLDDVDICRGVMNQVLSERERPLFSDLESYRRSFRFPIREFYADAGIADHDFVPAADRYLSLLEIAMADAQLRPDARTTLAELTRLGVPQILASATVTDALQRQLHPHAITDAFDEVLSIADAHAASKAEVIEEWIGRIGVDPLEVLLVGDTNHDREIAEALGARFVHCSFGHQDLSGELGLETIEALSEVLALV